MKTAKKDMKTVKEIADLYGVSRWAVYKWIRSGLPHTTERVIGVRRRVVIDSAVLADWLGLKDPVKKR